MVDLVSSSIFVFFDRAVAAWNMDLLGKEAASKGILAISFDLANHGSRCLDPRKNLDWTLGNKDHGEEMWFSILRTVEDVRLLQRLLPLQPYFPVGKKIYWGLLGHSLGGHAAIQAFFQIESLDVVISLLGSANLANVLLERANLAGAVISELCLKDMIETTSENLKKLSSRDSTTVGNSTTRKRWLGMIGGEDDKLVPWSHSQEFLSINPCNVVLKSWTQPGIGHKITPEMRTKCWQWLTEWKDSIQS